MHCIRSDSRNDEGSAAAGFALVAPLAVAVFVVVVQAAFLLVQRAVVQSAANAAARTAATLGSTPARGESHGAAVLASHGIAPSEVEYVWRRVAVAGVQFLEVSLDVPVEVAWLDARVVVHGSAAAVDENSL